jgi:AcrR family transcriptional regulator
LVLETPTPRRREIEDAASALFRRNGYPATSIRDIASALAIRGPSLYAHVTSKEDVLWAIVDRAASRFEAAGDEAEQTSAADPPARIAALARAHVDVVTTDPGEASVFVAEWRHLSPDRRAEILRRRDAYELRFRRAIGDGIAAGAFAMTDPAIAGSFLLSALNGIAAWYRPDGHLGRGRIADHYADLAVRSLTEAAR